MHLFERVPQAEMAPATTALASLSRDCNSEHPLTASAASALLRVARDTPRAGRSVNTGRLPAGNDRPGKRTEAPIAGYRFMRNHPLPHVRCLRVTEILHQPDNSMTTSLARKAYNVGSWARCVSPA